MSGYPAQRPIAAISQVTGLQREIGLRPYRMGRITLIGDSITEGIGATEWPYLLMSRLCGVTLASGSWSGSAAFTSLVGDKWTLYNAGIGGNSVADMVARFDQDVLAHTNDHCFILGGTNGVATVAASTLFADLQMMYAACVTNSIIPVLCTIPPQNSLDAGDKDNLDALNALITAHAASEGFHLIDFFSALESPAGSRSMPAEYTDDGIHPNAAGNAAMSAAIDISSVFGGVHEVAVDVAHPSQVTGVHGIVLNANDSVGLGHEVLGNNTGAKNAALGYQAMKVNTVGELNVALGFAALYNNTSGANNAAIGAYALNANTTGLTNMAIGSLALAKNTTGNNNTAIGYGALKESTTALSNTAIGSNTMIANTSGAYNTAVGYAALYSNTTGASNIGVGAYAGRFIADGSTVNAAPTGGVYVGRDTRASVAGATNETVIGYQAIGGGSNTVRLGSSTVTHWLPGATNVCHLGNAATAFKALYLSDGTDEYAVTVNTSGALVVTKV